MRRARLLAALSVPFGFVAGHIVGYGLGHADHDERALAEAGHEYLTSVARLALPLLALALAWALVAGARRVPLRPRLWSSTWPLLVTFTGTELFEHLRAGWPIDHVVTEPSLWLGLLTQVAVAAGVVALERLLVRVGRRLAATAPARPWAVLPSFLAPMPRAVLCTAVPLTSIRRRGPPRAHRAA